MKIKVGILVVRESSKLVSLIKGAPADDGQRFRLRPVRVPEVRKELLRHVADHPESISEDTRVPLVRVTQTRGWLKASPTQPDSVIASVPEVWPCF